jgi:glyoxylate utilization-related uncharacterized protein
MQCSSDPEAAGGLPRQVELTTGRAVFTEAHAFLPRGEMRDSVTGAPLFWQARCSRQAYYSAWLFRR